MSKENAIRFLMELNTNEKAKELLQRRERPNSKEDAVKAYAEAAAELDEDISEEDLTRAMEEIEAEIRQKTAAVSSEMEALNDEAVDDVAGGFYVVTHIGMNQKLTRVYDQCECDFTDTNCYKSDACAKIVVLYYDCPGEFFAKGAEYDCTYKLLCDFFAMH